ncbi:MAG: 16S rRNA (guanine(966)-N(2))-methyltransferase RsmD [Lachnospiraceae bacterium]|nr:16S rRNA (guanine(966)-N(2))-methyltransferase RsmD [Lachnospiraceae bacterium]
MRVIAGKARRIPLKTIEGDATRPTTDRIKETLFNILQNDLYEIRFLDLFAGSGGIGIEALSRGASFACFVDQSRAAANCIRENLKFTRLEAQAEVLICDVRTALERLNGQPPYQIIFMDPPYGKGLEDLVLQAIAAKKPSFVDTQTLFILEMAMGTDEMHLADYGYEILRVKEYKTNKHIFLVPMFSKEEEL